MNHISNLGIVHRTLTCQRILISELFQCKISGFEYAREVKESDQTYRIPDMVVSPTALLHSFRRWDVYGDARF